MYTKSIDEIATIDSKVADAIVIMIAKGFVFNYAYKNSNEEWDISFKTYLEEEDITKFLFDASKFVTCDTPYDVFPAKADENYEYYQRYGEDCTSIYLWSVILSWITQTIF